MIYLKSNILKPQRVLMGLFILLCFAASYGSAGQDTVIRQVMIETRFIETSQSMMMKIGMAPGVHLDEVFVKLPKKNLMQASSGFLPEGWDLNPEDNLLRIFGPKIEAPLHLRVDLGDSKPPKKVDIEVLLENQRLFYKKSIKVNERPALRVSNVLDDVLAFPPIVSPGDTIEFKPLDPKKTPIEGSWTVAGEIALRALEKNCWSVTLPKILTEETSFPLSYTDPYGLTLYEVDSLPDLQIFPPLIENRPFITGITKMAFPGDPICVCGIFPDITSRYGLNLNDQPMLQPVSSSSHVVVLNLPYEINPGTQFIGGNPDTGFYKENQLSFNVVQVNGSIDQNVLMRGQSTPLHLWLEGTDEIVQIEITNNTPGIISLEGGNQQLIATSGGEENKIERMVKGLKRGDFDISYQLELDFCPCEAISGPSDIAPITPDTYIGPKKVDDLLPKWKGTGDIAGVAEDLLNNHGKEFRWSNEGNPTGIATVDDMMNTRILSCFEFVDYCAWIAGPQETLRLGGSPKVSFNKASIITEGTQQKWDGVTPIPRGKIVCGWGQPPYDDRGAMQRTRGNYTHVAISLGNGYVISNSLGNNISIQRIEECFPPDEYTEVQFGDYNWKAQQMTEDPSKVKKK
ncbi:MAG: hypothetical protein JSV17_05430 [Candidatus Aminicenantes bacterium]|nr:MAG: hypothetical protein JSV17_05430 [Candidatus Aminicenantes bacterium]